MFHRFSCEQSLYIFARQSFPTWACNLSGLVYRKEFLLAAPKRTKFERERDLLEISRLYLQGITQAEIGQRLGVSQPQISYDLRVLRNRWLQSSIVNIDEAKARELARVDHLEREYWDAWEKSKNPVKTRGSKKVDGEQVESTIQGETGTGDPRYLTGVQWCINKRCEVLGLDAPSKTDVTSGGERIQVYVTEQIVAPEH